MSTVRLFMYDISNGMAKTLSPMFLGYVEPAIWHTSIVLNFSNNETEFFFDGGIGVEAVSPPATTRFGRPLEIRELGTTNKRKDEFQQWLQSVRTTYGPTDYNLLQNNCNHFSSAAAKFLVGQALPDEVTGMIQRILSTPMGAMISPMLQQITTAPIPTVSPTTHPDLANQLQSMAAASNNANTSNNNTSGFASASASTTNNDNNQQQQQKQEVEASINETLWEEIVSFTSQQKAEICLPSLLWVEGLLTAADNTTHSRDTVVYPNQSGTSNSQLDAKLLKALAFLPSSVGAGSYRFHGNDEDHQTAKMLVSSLVSELESRWSNSETTS